MESVNVILNFDSAIIEVDCTTRIAAYEVESTSADEEETTYSEDSKNLSPARGVVVTIGIALEIPVYYFFGHLYIHSIESYKRANEVEGHQNYI